MQKWGSSFGAVTPPLEARHFVSGLNSCFNGDRLSFAEYVAMNRDMIRKVRSGTQENSPNQFNLNNAVDGNSPFSLEPSGEDISGKEKKYRRGILLTHGLSDSPYFMRHLGAWFQAKGFRVMAVLLPGHGTRPGDLLDVTWQEWAKTVAYGTDALAAEVDEVYLGGYSAGGALSIYQSLQDTRVRGLFLFAPALYITHRAAFAILHKLVSWLFLRTKWVDIKPDKDVYKYESFAKNTATQMYQLTQVLCDRMKQRKLSIPIFAVASEDDKTVQTSATIAFMAQQTHQANKFILYTSEASKLAKNSPDEKIEWVNCCKPEQKILSSAHTAILIPAEDEHYGIDGEYASCAHYFPDDMERYDTCTQHPMECSLGEILEKNLAAGNLRRLMYNPEFASLKISLQQFIHNLP